MFLLPWEQWGDISLKLSTDRHHNRSAREPHRSWFQSWMVGCGKSPIFTRHPKVMYVLTQSVTISYGVAMVDLP
jgi:hypothetical protein